MWSARVLVGAHVGLLLASCALAGRLSHARRKERWAPLLSVEFDLSPSPFLPPRPAHTALSAHDAEQQRQTTLLFTNALLPACRKQLPGFQAMEEELTRWLHATYGIDVELFYAHGLRQGPSTLRSTGFDVHQEYTRG